MLETVVTENPPVLIVGAGPTGLVLALALNKLGIKVRIIDKVSTPGTTSRAMVVHARILEFYRQLGIADGVVKDGFESNYLNMWSAGKPIAKVDLSNFGKGIGPYPFVLMYPQDAHEKFLIDRLAEVGIQVEREVELQEFTQSNENILAILKLPNSKTEKFETKFIAGCDGAHSKVREVMNTGFPGGTYSESFYVADVIASGKYAPSEINVTLENDDFLILFPMKGTNQVRLIGTIKKETVNSLDEVRWENISQVPIRSLNIQVSKVNWFSTYRVHHRVTNQFRKHRAFLLGDAAHIHSPVGGQGMNTGISDAFNLAWKLSMVLNNNAESKLLDTYEIERKMFAQRLVATTDRAFTFITSRNPIINVIKIHVIPKLFRIALNFKFIKVFMFRTVSQTAVNYRSSPLSVGVAGVKAGDRLPWIKFVNGSDNFKPLQKLIWQIHIYGKASAEVFVACKELNLQIFESQWTAEMKKVDLVENAVYLVRPDGYVAFASEVFEKEALNRYIKSQELIF